MARLLLTEFVAACTPREQAQIRQWLISPAHNEKPELKRLYDHLCERIHELSIEPEKNTAFKAAWPDRTFNENVWSKLNYDLVQLMEDCLAYHHFIETPSLRQSQVLKNYRRKGLNRHYRIRLEAYRRKQAKEKLTSVDQYRFAYELEQHTYLLKSGNKRSEKHNLPAIEHALQQVVFAEKFRQFGRTLAHQRLFKEKFAPPLLDELVAAYQLSPQEDQPGVHLFYLATLLYTKPVAQADLIFQQLKTGLVTAVDQFETNDLRDLLIHAINHGVRRTNEGQGEYVRQTLELYQIGMQQQLFYEQGEIDIFTFNNIMGLALRLEEVDFAQRFLDENAHRLPSEKQEEVASLNRGRLAYQQKNYGQALRHLQTADYQDFIHHLTARVLQLKIFYERDDYNLLIAHIRSTKTLLRRRSNQGYHRNNYRNIFTLADKLLKLPPGDRRAKESLRQRIATTEPCTEKAWLLGCLG